MLYDITFNILTLKYEFICKRYERKILYLEILVISLDLYSNSSIPCFKKWIVVFTLIYKVFFLI